MGAPSIERQQDLTQRFRDLANSWLAATRFRSNTRVLRNHQVYRELLALGEPAVPLILTEVKKEPDVSWFLVLGAITGEDPVSPEHAGRVDAMAQAWLDWGRERGYEV